jgi:hypothetical protein
LEAATSWEGKGELSTCWSEKFVAAKAKLEVSRSMRTSVGAERRESIFMATKAYSTQDEIGKPRDQMCFAVMFVGFEPIMLPC